jgi:hypothetical protein
MVIPITLLLAEWIVESAARRELVRRSDCPPEKRVR